jgi:hypothetical protein
MLQAGELTSVGVQADPQIAGRHTQTLHQVYKGIPVEGGSVTLQRAGSATVAAFGTLFNPISIDTTPAIALCLQHQGLVGGLDVLECLRPQAGRSEDCRSGHDAADHRSGQHRETRSSHV